MSPWSVKRRRRRNFARAAVLAGMAAALVVGFSSAQATPESDAAEAVGNAIESYADRLGSASDALGEYGDLANNLPLTDLAPGDPGGLNLSDLLADAVGPLGSFTNMSQLGAAIEARDGAYGGVTVQFGAGAFTQPAVSWTANSITIPVHAERAVSQPLDFTFGDIAMKGGAVDVGLKLDTTLTFTADSAQITEGVPAPPTAVSLAPPTIKLCANATGSVGVFTARFGFTDVNVSTDDPSTSGTTEAAKLHACTDVVFSDPDSVGGITMDEWTSHALSELATAKVVKGNPSGNDLDAKLYVDATLVTGNAFASGGTADASIAFSDADLTNGFNETPTPAVSPGLQAWLNVSAGDVANGLTQFVASLAAAQGLGNGPLPLLGKSLSDIVDGVKPLLDYTEQLMNATVGCGTEPGDATHFPTGLTDNLSSGTKVYCRGQAQQPVDSGSVVWSVPAGVSATVLSNGTSDATLAQEPTAVAVFQMTGPGNFSAKASWTSAGKTKAAIPRPGSAQELFARLADAAGLDDAVANLGYDAATKSLTFRLHPDTPFDPAGVGVEANVGDLLRNTTNIAGLKQATGSLNADVDDVDFDLTFGVLLLPNTSDITPLRGSAGGTSSGATLDDPTANFTDGENDPSLGQVVTKTGANPVQTCTITAITVTTLTCAANWASGDAYDVDGGLIDRFYVKVDPSAPELSVGSISVTGNATLQGKVGFVEVEAGGDGAKNTADPGEAFSVGPVDADTPVLAVDIAAPNDFSIVQGGSATQIDDAVGIGELLANLDSDHVSATCNLQASAGLTVSADVNGKTLGSGSVAVAWPKVFEADSCKPDFANLDIDADTDFNLNLRDFDPFPSVSGTHTSSGPNDALHDNTKDYTKVGFKLDGATSPSGGNNLLNLTLRNKTTGASCTILTVAADSLGCTLSGGTRATGTDNNKWLEGDEYEVEGNALAWLGYILDNLDKLVDQIDAIDGDLTDRELPLVGISTKELVGKIKGIKQMTDELRGSALATVDCKQHQTGPDDAGFDLTQLPSGTTIWCNAVTTVIPTAVDWTVLEGSNISIADGQNLATVGSSPTARVAVTVGLPTPGLLVAISDWRVNVKFTDAGGDHNAEFPTAGPPRSLQELADKINEKLGVDNLVQFEVIDLPLASATAPRRSGTATAGVTEDNVLEDDASDDFADGTDQTLVSVGNLLINTTDNTHCSIVNVTEHVLTCAAGSDMQWDDGDDYEVVGDNTKDLVVRLGVNFCAAGGTVTCDPTTDQLVSPLSVPLNVKGDLADIVSVESTGDLDLYYSARAHLDVGIPIKLGIPTVQVLDTSGVSLQASVAATDIGLSAAVGPISVELGTAAAGGTGTGVGKLGAHLSLESDDDDVSSNKTQTFTDFVANAAANFEFAGDTQSCDDDDPSNPDPPANTASGHACALLSVSAVGLTVDDPIKIECNLDHAPADPLCEATLPPDLQSFLNGSELDWTLLLKVAQQILTKLETTLDGAAQDVKLPLVGNALDAGANVVGAFNTNVVTPFNDLVQQLTDATTAQDTDGDGDFDPSDLAKLAHKFVYDKLGPGDLDVLLDTNGDGSVTEADVVVTALCGTGTSACGDGAPLTQIKDFRVTFKLGQAIDGDVPFDLGLEGVPLKLTGGIHGSGSWSLLVDLGVSFSSGPYIVANGKKGFSDTGPEKREFDTHCAGTDPGDDFDCYLPVQYLQDDDTDFNNLAEIGMWLEKTSGTGSGTGCRVTKVEAHKLHCDDFGTTDVEGITWNGTDEYKLVARHAPDTPEEGGLSELQLKGLVSMANAEPACDSSTGLPSYLAGYGDEAANDRCLEGQIAFLKVNVHDSDGTLDESADCDDLFTADGAEPTALCLSASLDFKSSAIRVTFSDLVSGNFGFTPKLAGAANIDVRLRTGLNVGQSAGFPSVLGKFHLYWGFSITPGSDVDYSGADPLAVSFDGLALDAGKFITEFLGPMIKQVKQVTNPLMPVVELIQGEVPIISDLSKLIGQGPVTVLDLLEAISGNDLSLMRSILQMIKFVNSLPSNAAFVIPLGSGGDPGSFAVDTSRAVNSAPIPEEADKGITPASKGTNLIDKLKDGDGTHKYAAAKDAPAQCDRGATFGVCGLTFPFFGDAGQIFGVLMGKDATLVHYDAGSFGAGAGFGFCFPPIIIGPVPVQICIGGSFRVEGRFAMGYDTAGLRKVLAGGTGTHLLDGIYFDDYDAHGVDVPEVKFTGRVYAEGAVSVYIFKVGIRGEIIFTTGLNLHEDAPRDGKLRIEEIISKIYNPLCLFDVEGKIEAALSAFVKIDLFITSVEFSIEIVRITLLEFNLSICNIKPVLAHNETAGSVEKLVLNMGSSSLRTARGTASGEINETFTVRQMESAGGKTRFSVTAFGIQQDYFLPTAKVGTVNAKLVANADDGDDVISLLPGSAQGEQAKPNQQKPPIPFTLWADIDAGTGNDEVTSGDGNDDVKGNDGNDALSTGGGADVIAGGKNDDKIDAGAGADSNVHGNEGIDIVNGGPGSDDLFGDADDDIISAGPGDSGSSVDSMTGGPGNDAVNADGGGDKLWGDEGGLSFDCTADSGNDGSTNTATGNGRDTLIGADGNDQMHGGNNADTLDGANGNDKMCGGGGNDELTGALGKDAMSGNGGDDNLVGGSDDATGDVLNGNGGRDYLVGDEGTLTRDGSNNVAVSLTGSFSGADAMNGGPNRDFMWGQNGADTMNGNAGNDYMLGGLANDVMNGNENDDEMYGEDGVDAMHGNAGNDYMRGGPATDTMDGDDGNDELYGDGEADIVRGGANDDLVRGGGGDDYIEGNGNDSSALPLDDALNLLANANLDLHLEKDAVTGAWAKVGGGDGDVVYGDAGQDDIIGGSTTAVADSGDTIVGNTEQDVIFGDNGTITRPGGTGPDGTITRTVTLSDPGGSVAANSGGDWIQGSLGNDDIYAGGGADLVNGNEGDDYVEGNGGSDGAGALGGAPVAAIGLYGDTGQDDIIGGTSQGGGTVADGADDIWGGEGHDVAAGDNATITRTGGGTCGGFVCNTFRNTAPAVQDVVIRRIQLWDVATTAAPPVAGTSGGDTVDGQDGHDRIYGQGGGDNLKGGLNDDFVFGNDGADTIFGGDAQDDLVGGTGRTDSATASTATDGRVDAGDLIYGENDFDAIAGDNSRIVRKTSGADDDHGLWARNTFNGAVDRLIALMDVGVVGLPAGVGTSGNDQLLGGAADDVIYGQGGNDGISGGADQDLLEGNANGSGNAPDPAATYGAAWPAFAGDVIHGDAGADDIGGGTGRIYRMVGGVETQDVLAGVDGRLDGGDTIFGDAGGDAIGGDNTVIERALTAAGAWILDDLHNPDALQVVRRVTRERDVATTANLAPLTNGTSGADTIYGNDGPDVAYGQAGEDTIQGNAGDDHLEGSANDDTITGNEGRDDITGGTGRTFSNDESTATAGRIDNPTGDDAANDSLHGGDGAGGVAGDDDDVILGDNGTVDRVRGTLGTLGAEVNRLPFNGAWGEATWDEPNILRVIRLLDVATTVDTAPETNATNGDDTIAGEASEDVVFGGGGTDAISGDDADLDGVDPGDAGADDYIEGNGGADTILGNLGQDDITGGGSASHVGLNGLLDSNRDGTLDATRSGETLRDGNDLLTGDNGVGAVGQGDVIAGDNARIQRLLSATGDWRLDSQRGTTLRDVMLFDLDLVGTGEPGDSSPGESGVDTISGNGGEDILLGQANGAVADAYGTESGVAGTADCQNATGGPGSGTLSGTEEAPNGDDDNDDLPDLNDPQCRNTAPGDTVLGEGGNDYIEGNQGSDNTFGGEGEDDVIGGSSSNSGRLNAILPPADRSAGFAPGAIEDANRPFNLLDGHDVVQGNAEDDVVLGDNAFIDRYVGAAGVWLTLAGPGTEGLPATPRRNEEPARGPWTASNLVRRDVTTRTVKESPGAFGNDFVQGGGGKDDVYGLLGNDWLEGNEDEDAIVGDMGKIVNNQLGGPTPDTIADPPLNRFITPDQPFLGSTINYVGTLKREVELYAFDESQAATVGIGHDVALGGDANDAIHTGPGEDLANGNAGDDRIWLGDNFTATTAAKGKAQPRLAHDRVDAGWGGTGHDHIWGGYGADYLDVRPRTTSTTTGLTPTSDPETWFQVAGKEPSHNVVGYNQENFEGFDYVYGGWDQDAMQANEGANGPIPGDRLLDWAGVYNAYYVCPPTYGDWVSTRAVSPGMVDFLQSMSQGFGASNTATRGTSGFRETAIVFPNEHGQNANPIHPDTPAHFTCGPGVTIP